MTNTRSTTGIYHGTADIRGSADVTIIVFPSNLGDGRSFLSLNLGGAAEEGETSSVYLTADELWDLGIGLLDQARHLATLEAAGDDAS